MDSGGCEKFDPEKGNRDPSNYQSSNFSPFGRFGGSAGGVATTSIGLIPSGSAMAMCKGDQTPASVVDSYCPNPTWGYDAVPQPSGLCNLNVQTDGTALNTSGIRKGIPVSMATGISSLGWNPPPSSMLKGGIILPNVPAILPQSLSQVAADSGFIERAAWYSCFGAGNFSSVVNQTASMFPYTEGDGMLQRPHEAFAGDALRVVSGGQSQNNELGIAETSNNISLSVEHAAAKGKRECFAWLQDDAKDGIGVSGNEPDEVEFSSSSAQEETSVLEGRAGESSAKEHGLRKRKRSDQDVELNQGIGAPTEISAPGKGNSQNEGDQNVTSTTNKSVEKQRKHGSQSSEPPKEGYIHVRARRGQATNSHSLAERVRREKISERMKFLQDLVPGCSKVTGKAVMLDEIINYVQSLQQQVEFLSMKLATINPTLDLNIDGLIAKDILPSRAGPSCALGFSPDLAMAYSQAHPSQTGLVQANLPSTGIPSDARRRNMASQLTLPVGGGLREPTQLPNIWEDELHNVVQISLDATAPSTSQDIDVSLPLDHVKVEL